MSGPGCYNGLRLTPRENSEKNSHRTQTVTLSVLSRAELWKLRRAALQTVRNYSHTVHDHSFKFHCLRPFVFAIKCVWKVSPHARNVCCAKRERSTRTFTTECDRRMRRAASGTPRLGCYQQLIHNLIGEDHDVHQGLPTHNTSLIMWVLISRCIVDGAVRIQK